MKQALHIFRKDIRYLRFEICLLVMLATFFAWSIIRLQQAGWSEALFQFAAVYTIARLIHAEAVPGDRQFWLTRPYKPVSLAGAKLLFMFVFICLPMGLAQIAMLVAGGFPLIPAVPGLLCSQALLFFAEALPVAALSAITSSFVSFILAALVLAFVAFAVPTGAMIWFPIHAASIPRSVDWVRTLMVQLLLVAIAGAVFCWQYRDRSTPFSRIFGVLALSVAGGMFLFIPPSLPLTVQGWLSSDKAIAAPITASIDKPTGTVSEPRGPNRDMRVPLLIRAGGMPANAELRADALSLSFEWPGQTWKPARSVGLNRRSQSETGAIFNASAPVEEALFYQQRTAPLTIRGAIYLTLFGDDEARTISLRQGFSNVQDGLQCGQSEFMNKILALSCRSFFRWPSRLVYARAGTQESDFINTLVSYSPLPADLTVDALESRWGDPVRDDNVTIVTRKPLVHFHRDFELRGIRLADFENRPPIR